MNQIHTTIKEINGFLKSMPWCDFEIFEMSGSKLILLGSISTSYPFDIKIIFDGVFHVQCNCDWKTNTSQDVISVVEDNEARELNIRYQVEIGNHVFKIIPEDVESPFYIIAQNICYETGV